MDRLELVVVQLIEARRLADVKDDAHLRLALILLDNAAETVLFRQASNHLYWEDFERNLAGPIEEAEELPPLLEELRSKVRAAVLSNSRRRRIERLFGPTVDYLVERQLLDKSIGRALHRLHTYRNEVYHQDRIRKETLETAVALYYWLVCGVLADLRLSMLLLVVPAPPGIASLVGEGAHRFSLEELPGALADQLRAGYGLDEDAICDLLSEHLVHRLEGIRENLEFVADYMTHGGTPTSPAEVFHHVQIEGDLGSGWLVPEVLNAQQVAHDMTSFDGWEARAREVANVRPVVAAFGRFGDIEDELEPVESKVADAAVQVDRAIQRHVDIARGK